MHWLAPDADWYVPDAQKLHTEAPAMENMPVTQVEQMEMVEADEWEKRPAAQDVHDVCPALDWYFPATQLAHLEDPTALM